MQTQTRVDVSHYSYRVTWSAEDGEFVATCLEFPSLSWLAPTQIEALEGLEAVVSDVLTDMAERREKIPVPFSERTNSGTFNVRIGEGLHRDLVVHAAEDGLSLNQYVVKKLASA
jgi:predicted HicB family RNase H-like nuclease